MCIGVFGVFIYMLDCMPCVCVFMVSGSCIVVFCTTIEEDYSLLRAVHQRVFKVMDEPLL